MKKVSGLKLAVTAVLVAGALSPLNALAANKFIVMDATGTTPQFVVTDAGWIGVGTGTASPTKPIQIEGASTAAAQIYSHVTQNNVNGGGGVLLYHNNAGGAMPNAGDRLGYFLFGGVDNVFTGGRGFNGCGIVARAEGAWSSDGANNYAFPSYFAFETTASNVRTEKMRITGSGNLGIGTTAPTSKLHVVGLPVFANNAAAVTGGLTPGAFYRTGGDPDVVAVVH